MVAPFAGVESTGFQSMGLLIGNGDQDNYIKLVVNNTGVAGGVELLAELAGEVALSSNMAAGIAGADYADLYLMLDPANRLLTAFYRVTTAGVAAPLQAVGDAVVVPDEWLSGPTKLAVGIISTSNSGVPFPATWDFIEVTNDTQMLSVDTSDNSAPLLTSCRSADQGCVAEADIVDSAERDASADTISGLVAVGSGSILGSAERIDLLLLFMLFTAIGVLNWQRNSGAFQ